MASPAHATGGRLVLGAVAAMDVRVAIHAAPRDGAECGAAGGAAGRQLARLARVAGVAVAFLAQEWRARLQQAGDGRAVRLVADRAVLLHRRMVMHERAALLHVAGEAGLVHAVAHELLRIAAVHVVARRARHLSLDDRVVHRPVHLHALLLVAGEAGVALRDLVAHWVARRVDQVAGAARDVLSRMLAHLPLDAARALMAREAHLRARGDRRLRSLREADVGLRPPAARGLVHVALARAVAARAARRARVGARAVLGLADGEHRIRIVLVVAARALRVAGQDLVLRRRVLRQRGACEQHQDNQASHRATLISLGPGPSGSVWAIPKWQSMQVVRSALALAWRSRAISLCFSGSIASGLWQLRHSCESFFFMRVHSRTAMAWRAFSYFSLVSM